jgi:pantoate--beta-alanine ligase
VTVRIATTIDVVRQAVKDARKTGQTIGLVPTMGALHAAHASLIRTARADSAYVVVSVFVNPAQFGPEEDLARYPRPFDKDMALCAEENVQLVFAPEPAVIYPPDFRTSVEVTELQDTLCGASRPGHFRGVATVVLKLFNIVQPDVAYFGQKDAQQARILQQMTVDLNLPVRLVVCPIVREPDGLALSSRNQYLDRDQRRQATVLYQALEDVQKSVSAGERQAAKLVQQLQTRIQSTPGARLDYAAVVDADSLKPITQLEKRVLVAVAVYFGSTRLIDNVVLDINHNNAPSPNGY